MSGIIIMFEPDEMMMKRVFFLLLMFAHKQNMQAVRSIQAGSLNLSAFTSYMMMMRKNGWKNQKIKLHTHIHTDYNERIFVHFFFLLDKFFHCVDRQEFVTYKL